MHNLNNQFIISMLIISLGYISRRLNILKEQDGEGIARVIFNFTLPSVVITVISSSKIDPALTFLPLISVVYGILMALLALLLFRKESRNRKGMLSIALPGLNIALFAYPLVEAIWGKESLRYLAMFDMGNGLIIFGVCYLFASYYSGEVPSVDFKSIFFKMLRSVPLMAFIVTLIIYLSGLSYPRLVLDITSTLSKANTPLSLLLLGIYLSFNLDSSYLKDIAKVLVVRYVIGICTGVLLYYLLPFDTHFRNITLIGFILPVASSTIAYSVQFGYDKRFIAAVTNISLVFSFILLWIVANIFTV